MLEHDNEQALTADDVAEMLHVSKSTVYNLVRSGDLHSYTIGRKIRFTHKQVRDYIAWSASKQHVPKGKDKDSSYRGWLEKQSHTAEDLVICGHDLILDVLANYLNQGGVPASRLYVSSYDGLTLLYHDEVQVASVHMWDARTDEYNVPYVRQLLPATPASIIRLATRTQGFCVARGNPKNIEGWRDVVRSDVRMANRKKGTGSRVLLDGHISLLGIDADDINGYDHELASTLALAEAVALGAIDVGLGSEQTIRQVDEVDFIPLQKEHYDLVVKQKAFTSLPVQAMLHVIRSLPFKKQFQGHSGYETAQMGRVVARL